MRERRAILDAWARELAAGREAVLVTIVRVEGSSYRDVGARMLVLEHGERVGGVSGGCLEQEIVKQAFYRTDAGPRIEAFSTRSEDDGRPYGMGCEGVVHVLLERLSAARQCPALELIAACEQLHAPGVLASVIASPEGGAGTQLALGPDGRVVHGITDAALAAQIELMARACLGAATSEHAFEHGRGRVEVVMERIDPPRALVVFGAGEDAMPVVRIAKELGWHVTVADGRAHYATAARFPQADRIVVRELGAALEGVPVPAGAACVVMSHSFEQDARALAMLAPLPLAYLGLLGPPARRRALLDAISGPQLAGATGLHGPVGLDIGAETPEEIALAIVAEAQACFAARAGGFLRDGLDGADARDAGAFA